MCQNYIWVFAPDPMPRTTLVRVSTLQYRAKHLIFLLLFLLLSISGAGSTELVKVIIGGKPAQFQATPVRQDNDIYLPLESLDAIGAKIIERKKPIDGHQELGVLSFEGRRFECKARIIDGHPMLCVQDIADELGACTEWNNKSATLSIRAAIRTIEFDGSHLEVTTAYPVNYSVTRWTAANKLILDIFGVALPSSGERIVHNRSLAGVRLGSRDSGETVRIVLDLPKITSHRLKSGPKTSKIVVEITPAVLAEQMTSGATTKSLIPAGRLASSKGEPAAGQPTTVIEEKSEQSAEQRADINSKAITTTTTKPAVLPVQVTDIICHPRDEDTFEVEVVTDKPAEYQTWIYRNPDRVYLDISNATLCGEFGDLMQDHRLVLGVRPMQQNSGLVRIAIDMTRVAAPVVRRENDPCRLIVSLEPPKASGGSLASKIIVIDPGHGGPGSAGRGAIGCNGTMEKVVNLQIAERVDQLLKKEGACSILTRRDNDTYIEVNARPLFAKRHSADIFLSIHNNSCGKINSMSGTETYFHRWEPSSRALATCIHTEVVAVTGLPDNGTRSDLRLYKNGLGVLRAATSYGIPAALIEIAYINHAGDEKLLNDPEFQQRVAEAIVRGLKAYVEGNSSESRQAGTTATGKSSSRDMDSRREKG